MSNEQKAVEILQAILAIINHDEDMELTLSHDWGGNTATVLIDGYEVFHLGNPNGDFNLFLDDFHSKITQEVQSMGIK